MSENLPTPGVAILHPPDVPHAGLSPPSAWLERFAALIAPGARVLDYACGSGRHARWLAARGMQVDAIDRDRAALDRLQGVTGVRARELELEGDDWPLAGESYAAVVVTNYLYRPRFDALLALLPPGGVLIYETFMVGNERFGKPSNPDFLLRSHELLETVADACTVLAYEQGEVAEPKPAVIQRICAVKGHNPALRLP